jgi:hypothetical protein
VLPSIERTEPDRTVIVPRVPPPPARGRLRFLLPWLAFGAVAVAVVVGTSLWSVTLRSAGRTSPEPAGIDTAMVPAAPPVAALPTTPAAPVPSPAPVTTAAAVRSPKPRLVAPPPPQAEPAPAPRSVPAPPGVPPTDPAPSSEADVVGCDEAGELSPSCVAPSAPPSRLERSAVAND